jgi:cation diffusion facilitator family transporter
MIITQKLALGSVAVSIAVLGVKLYAWQVTGSVALLSDALESIINVATALAAVWALNVALQPADERHPYGHTKAEYLSAVLEGVLIVGAAIAILHEAYLALLAPRPIDAPVLGLALSSVGSVVNAAWSLVLQRQGRRHRSPALVADGRHLQTDVVTSLGVVVGVGLVVLTGRLALDPVLAGLVALHVLWSGWGLMKESVNGLLDEAMPDEELGRLKTLIAENAEGAIEAHDIKTRCAGKLTFIEFHLVVAGDATVTEAHDICDRLERVLKAEVPEAAVTIHVEPEDKRKHQGIVVL